MVFSQANVPFSLSIKLKTWPATGMTKSSLPLPADCRAPYKRLGCSNGKVQWEKRAALRPPAQTLNHPAPPVRAPPSMHVPLFARRMQPKAIGSMKPKSPKGQDKKDTCETQQDPCLEENLPQSQTPHHHIMISR